jgi:hypothetical protein
MFCWKLLVVGIFCAILVKSNEIDDSSGIADGELDDLGKNIL